jgi:UDP-N-acetyl-D-galactosamine dehydrogenase
MTKICSRSVSVIGLGYVGLPVAVAFGKIGQVVAFDINAERLERLRSCIDDTGEIAPEILAVVTLKFTSDPKALRSADFHIIAVPTPIDEDRRPDLRPLLAATATVGGELKRGDIVVYESTVYPGATEEDCVPLLEQHSGLQFGRDFSVGYSPERINPGDQDHRLETITKVVSGSDHKTLEIVAEVYGAVVTAGVYRAASIRVAEAAKVIENTQRDLNIALVNELALIFHRMGIDTNEVLDAAATKWNFLPFRPGLVGGHCIGVDPYYLTHRAQRTGYHPEVVLAGRRINDNMGRFIAQEGLRLLMQRGVARPSVTVFGLTFKENVPDVRNSRVPEMIAEFARCGIEVEVHDPIADPEEAKQKLKVDLLPVGQLRPADAVILAVPHREFVAKGWDLVRGVLRNGSGIVMDVKSALEPSQVPNGIALWRL